MVGTQVVYLVDGAVARVVWMCGADGGRWRGHKGRCHCSAPFVFLVVALACAAGKFAPGGGSGFLLNHHASNHTNAVINHLCYIGSSILWHGLRNSLFTRVNLLL